jgi:ERCC4-type nuclease
MEDCICVKIDNREQKIKEVINTLENKIQGFVITYDNLPCGDIVFSYNGDVIVVFERKTLGDLLASIKDGRYRIQKDNMMAKFGTSRVMYIIEGELEFDCDSGDVDHKSVVTSIINTQLRDNIKIIQTKHIHQTCHFILEICARLVKNPTIYLKMDAASTSTQEDFIKKAKINGKGDLFFHQMAQIPGVSTKTAQAFVESFETMNNFYLKMCHLDNSEKLKLLQNIFITEQNKKRRISSKVISNILQYMF